MDQDAEDDKKPEPGVLKHVYLDPTYVPSDRAGAAPMSEDEKAAALAAVARELGIQPNP